MKEKKVNLESDFEVIRSGFGGSKDKGGSNTSSICNKCPTWGSHCQNPTYNCGGNHGADLLMPASNKSKTPGSRK